MEFAYSNRSGQNHPPSRLLMGNALPARAPKLRLRTGCLLLAGALLTLPLGSAQSPDPDSRKLAGEVGRLGYLLFAARTAQGDYDLFLSRPDGTARRNLTGTPEWSEFGGRFSPDGRRMLYRRQKKGPDVAPGEGINHDVWGAQGSLVLAEADGSNPQAWGTEGEWPWASWSPDGARLACLYRRQGRIRIIDIPTRQTLKELPRQGIFQQMYWSPDGKRLCGTANFSGQDWNIVSLELETGKTTQVSRGLNCTADWFQGDPLRLIYSHRLPGLATSYGWTMLMEGTADGAERNLLYAERGRHVYFGCTSPDGRYLIFSVPQTDGGTDALMAIIRRADAPIIVPDDYKELQALCPGARSGPVFRLPFAGFEPHWGDPEIRP